MAKLRITSGSEIPPSFGQRRRAKKMTLVTIRQPSHSGVIESRWGQMRFDPDLDYIIDQGQGDVAAIKKSVFSLTYEAVGDGKFRKSTIVELVQVPKGFEITLATQEGDLDLTYPDYIAIGIQDEVYPNSEAWVEQNLKLLP